MKDWESWHFRIPPTLNLSNRGQLQWPLQTKKMSCGESSSRAWHSEFILHVKTLTPTHMETSEAWKQRDQRPSYEPLGHLNILAFFWRGLRANKSVNNFPPLWTNCYWILLKWSPLFLWKDWCLLLPRVWRILPVKSELLVYRGHWLLPSYISIKNVGVTLTLSYCAAETRSSGGDSRAGE